MPGYTSECMSGQHHACVDSDCRCGCHARVQAMMSQKAPLPVPPGLPPAQKANLICPACGKRGKFGDAFCRADGVRLIEGKICACGSSGEPLDVYCGACGQRFGAEKVPDLSEEEIALLEKKARARPSDIEFPPMEIQ